MPYVPTTDQIINILIEELPKKMFDFLMGQLTMEDIFMPA